MPLIPLPMMATRWPASIIASTLGQMRFNGMMYPGNSLLLSKPRAFVLNA